MTNEDDNSAVCARLNFPKLRCGKKTEQVQRQFRRDAMLKNSFAIATRPIRCSERTSKIGASTYNQILSKALHKVFRRLRIPRSAQCENQHRKKLVLVCDKKDLTRRTQILPCFAPFWFLRQDCSVRIRPIETFPETLICGQGIVRNVQIDLPFSSFTNCAPTRMSTEG